ncbi:MAG: GatB/YqeY domain-containing protein [Bacteroidota bacterium]
MSLEETINNEVKTAMLARDKDKLEALRAIKSALLLAKTEKGSSTEMGEETEIKILQKLVKQRRETADIYLSQNRNDLADIELFQANIIQEFLPKAMPDDELEAIIKAAIAETGAASIKDMGKVMGVATKQLAGRADNARVSVVVKRLLGI